MNKPALVYIIESTSGGSKRHVIDALEGLTGNGFKSTLYYSTYRQDSLFSAELKRLQDLGVRCVKVDMTRHFSSVDIKAIFFLLKDIKKWVRKNQKVVIHGHSSKGGMIARIVALLLKMGINKRRGATVYTPHSPITMDPTLSKNKKLFFSAAEYLLATITNKIVAVSIDEYNHIYHWPLCKRKVEVVYNGIFIDVKKTSFQPSNADSLHFLFVGRLSHQKNPIYALEIIKNIKGSSLTIIGDGELRNEVENYIFEHNLSDRVTMVGFSSDVGQYYRQGQPVILSSRYEGFPYVVLEAMMHGCILIGCDVPGLRGILMETGNVLIPESQPLHAANLILEYFKDTDRVNDVKRKNIEVIESTYNVNRMVTSLENLYLSLSG